ncbi:MAG: hypothetical protein ACT4PQ_10040 [Betaproteobacteria bacterium]
MDNIFRARFVWYRGAADAAGRLFVTLGGMIQLADIFGLVGVRTVFGMGQLSEAFVGMPSLVGNHIGLYPVAVIFALPVKGQLSGYLNVPLVLPGSAALSVGLRRLRAQYPGSGLDKS